MVRIRDEGGSWRLGRRPALDGLRGIAIILVLAAHAGVPGLFHAGGVGVGLFFALSGFLITALLLEERDRTGRVDLLGFWGRRARRLLPALVALVVVMAAARLLVGSWLVPWSAFAPVLLYLANWVPATGGSLGMLGHAWTLAVEEQFYLVWPLLVILFARSRRALLVLAVALGVASLVARYWLLIGGASFTRVNVGSDTVAVALLAGVVAVLVRRRGGVGVSRPWLVLGCMGVLAVFSVAGPVWMVILGFPAVSVASGLAVWAATGSGLPWLEARWLRWFGSRSYGIYLWHAPIVLIMGGRLGLPWWVVVSVGVPISLLVAEGSYRWVEGPFRARRNAPHPAEAEQGASVVVVVSGTGVGDPTGTR